MGLAGLWPGRPGALPGPLVPPAEAELAILGVVEAESLIRLCPAWCLLNPSPTPRAAEAPAPSAHLTLGSKFPPVSQNSLLRFK